MQQGIRMQAYIYTYIYICSCCFCCICAPATAFFTPFVRRTTSSQWQRALIFKSVNSRWLIVFTSFRAATMLANSSSHSFTLCILFNYLEFFFWVFKKMSTFFVSLNWAVTCTQLFLLRFCFPKESAFKFLCVHVTCKIYWYESISICIWTLGLH